MTSCFPGFRQKKGLQETLSRKQFKRQKRLVFNRRLRMIVSIKLLSQILQVLEILITLKNNHQNLLYSKCFMDFSRIKKKRNTCERTFSYVYVYKCIYTNIYIVQGVADKSDTLKIRLCSSTIITKTTFRSKLHLQDRFPLQQHSSRFSRYF